MKKYILKVYYKLLDLKDLIVIFYNKKFVSKRKPPIVLNTDITLEKIVGVRCSVSRFGDGEFALMYGENLIFQPQDKELSLRLKEVINSNIDNHIVCLPNIFEGISWGTENARRYWINYLNKNRHKIYKFIDRKKVYYDALVTRLYMDYENKINVEFRFNKLKSLWDSRDLVVVEGEKSRMGIGNNLFSNSNSIKRIICPSKNAFSKYKEILESVKEYEKDKLILISLGPTATILAYDLSKEGYQAIDIGHIDIEYEWFLKGVKEKIPIKNKYIGEIDGGEDVDSLNDDLYESQIQKRII